MDASDLSELLSLFPWPRVHVDSRTETRESERDFGERRRDEWKINIAGGSRRFSTSISRLITAANKKHFRQSP